jgi:hypothetical protein
LPKGFFEKNVTRLDTFARVIRHSGEFGASGHCLDYEQILYVEKECVFINVMITHPFLGTCTFSRFRKLQNIQSETLNKISVRFGFLTFQVSREFDYLGPSSEVPPGTGFAVAGDFRRRFF